MNKRPPYNYNEINTFVSSYEPNTLHNCDNARFLYWQRSLFQRVQSIFEIDNIPDAWKGRNKNFLDFVLIAFGFCVVSDDTKYGKFFAPASLTGRSLYYQPTLAIINNPVMAGRKLKIGKDCELLQLTPDYMGLYDIINYFAEQLALVDTASNTSLVNSKIPYILGDKTKGVVQAIKNLLDRVNEGNTATFFDSRIQDDKSSDEQNPFQQVKLFTKDDYITDKLLQDRNTILNEFDNEIGIPNVPYEKKERLISAEINTQKVDATARCSVWLECLKSSCDLINAHYGLNLAPRLTYNTDETGRTEEGDTNA